jgi:signal transduction histidine kinase
MHSEGKGRTKMYSRAVFPLSLLALPSKVRLSLVILAYPVSFILYWYIFPITHNGTMILLPTALAAWMFRARTAILCALIAFLGVVVLNSLMLGTLVWPPGLAITSLLGFFTAMLIGLMISSVRYALNQVESARKQIFEAEQQKVLAYEQRLEAIKAEHQMEVAYNQQRHMNQLKDQFILNVNHELRTPLTETYGYLEILNSYHETLDEQTQEDFLQKALEGCETLIQLVNNVLAATYVSSEIKEPNFEAFIAAPIVEALLEQMVPREKQEHRFRVSIPEALSIRADREYFRRILHNLLSNACKYSPRHTLITIQASQDVDDSNQVETSSHVRFCVQDTGPGIPVNEIPLLFEKFVRLKRDLSGRERGTGLGLYLCKQLVEAMDGRIWVESTGIEGEGSFFYFTLPGVPRLPAS